MKHTIKITVSFLFMSLFIIPVNHLYAVISNEIYFQSILFESDGQNWIRLGFKKDTLLNYYSRNEIDNLLIQKSDESNTYTRAYLDNQLNLKADSIIVQTALNFNIL